MAKLNLNDVGSLIDATTAQTTINNNNTLIETALEKTLSRDGTSPNQMTTSLDMNSEQILNLPLPATDNSPLRLIDLNDFIGGGTVTNIPPGGTSGQVLAKQSNDDYDVDWESSLSSVSNADGTITATTVDADVDVKINLAHANTWTGQQTFVAPALGTPASGILTNTTGLPIATGVSGLGTGVATFLATPTSANLASAVTNETGSGALVFATSPALVTPTGIVKGDVGLGNVDNTSDATKNAAAVTLTNKTLTTPVINGLPTGTGVATANTASTLVARDGSGDFTARNISASNIILPTSAPVNGPSIGNGSNTVLITSGTSGLQLNNQTNAAALLTLTNAGALRLNTYGAGFLRTDSSGNITVSPNKSALVVRVNRTTNQTPTINTWVKVQLNVEVSDPNNWFDSVTNFRFQPNVAGVFAVTGSVNLGVAAAGYGGVSIYKNGVEYNKYILDAPTNNQWQLTVPALVELNGSSDYIELFGYSSNATPVFNGGAEVTKLDIHQLY